MKAAISKAALCRAMSDPNQKRKDKRCMEFQAKTKQQIDDERLLPRGSYDFLIEAAEEKTSAAGNGMIELTVRVSNGNGQSRKLTDYILPQRAEKLRNCCAACGLLDKYEHGAVNDNDF